MARILGLPPNALPADFQVSKGCWPGWVDGYCLGQTRFLRCLRDAGTRRPGGLRLVRVLGVNTLQSPPPGLKFWKNKRLESLNTCHLAWVAKVPSPGCGGGGGVALLQLLLGSEDWRLGEGCLVQTAHRLPSTLQDVGEQGGQWRPQQPPPPNPAGVPGPYHLYAYGVPFPGQLV